ncbi:MAG TPA: flavodoxin family protein [Anaerovoracaceae bacterium]|nr:flavodoxin family protein [Anaerovoracaceae bacterium]
MKKVTALIGSPRKQATYEAVLEFEKNLKSYGEMDFEIVFLKDYRIEYCRGCCNCFRKGEAHCPIQDDRDLLLEKMERSDGVIFATPNYSFQVSAPMKTLMDRLAFILHRPRFFGKTFTSVVTQGIIGGNAIEKYLGSVGKNYGFKVTKGCVLNSLEPVTDDTRRKNTLKIKKASQQFYREMMRSGIPVPSFFRLLIFRMARTSIKSMLNDNDYDFRHFKEKGWFESDYYYDTQIGPLKKITGNMFDFLGGLMFRHA